MNIQNARRLLDIPDGELTEDMILSGYKRCARIYHPDKNNQSSDSISFSDIVLAKTVLLGSLQPVPAPQKKNDMLRFRHAPEHLHFNQRMNPSAGCRARC